MWELKGKQGVGERVGEPFLFYEFDYLSSTMNVSTFSLLSLGVGQEEEEGTASNRSFLINARLKPLGSLFIIFRLRVIAEGPPLLTLGGTKRNWLVRKMLIAESFLYHTFSYPIFYQQSSLLCS